MNQAPVPDDILIEIADRIILPVVQATQAGQAGSGSPG
jgi:hypothetical protein